MGYRATATPPPNPEDMIYKFPVRNGSTLRLAFACNYLKVPPLGHDSHYHDFVGWPSPSTPGNACQMRPPRDGFRWLPKPLTRENMDEFFDKIFLKDEGYTAAVVSFEDTAKAANVSAQAWIDDSHDQLVRISITPNFPAFERDPVDLHFTVFIKKPDDDHPIIDAVYHGVALVLPGGPFPSE